MVSERLVREIVVRALRETRSDIAPVKITETPDGRKYVLQARTSDDCEHLLVLRKRAVARILGRPFARESLRDLIGTELIAQRFRRVERDGMAALPTDGERVTCPTCAEVIVPGDRVMLRRRQAFHLQCSASSGNGMPVRSPREEPSHEKR